MHSPWLHPAGAWVADGQVFPLRHRRIPALFHFSHGAAKGMQMGRGKGVAAQ
jgi:hypothetical protein